MGGVHGTVMPFYTEELVPVTYFNMLPAIASGYGARLSEKIIRVVIHTYSAPPNAEGDKARKVNDFVVNEKKPFMWAEDALTVGWFILHEDDVYRIVSANRWEREGDMVHYALEKVVGSDGTDTVNPAFNTGANTFS